MAKLGTRQAVEADRGVYRVTCVASDGGARSGTLRSWKKVGDWIKAAEKSKPKYVVVVDRTDMDPKHWTTRYETFQGQTMVEIKNEVPAK